MMSRIVRLMVAVVIACMGLAGVMQHAGAQDDGTGTVRVLKYYCSNLDSTIQMEAVGDDCAPGSATGAH